MRAAPRGGLAVATAGDAARNAGPLSTVDWGRGRAAGIAGGAARRRAAPARHLDTLPFPAPLPSRYDLPLPAERELAYQRLRMVCRSGLVSMLDFR